MAKEKTIIYQASKRVLALSLTVTMIGTMLCGCDKEIKYEANSNLDTSKNITLVIGGSTKNIRAFDVVAKSFNEIYPNCKIEYEYIQDYDENLPKRIDSNDDKVDLFMTTNIQAESPKIEYALDILEYQDKLKLDDTHEGLVENFTYIDSEAKSHLYSIPLGGEMRGIYVNVTFLDSLGLEVPTNSEEFLAACDKIEEAGYIPIQDNPGAFGQRMVFPSMAHTLADSDNKDEVKTTLATCEDGSAEIFKEQLKFLYDLTVENYYNYKYVETEKEFFLDLTDESIARYFLNVKGSEDDYEKVDDVGEIAFMTAANSLKPTIDKVKEDYHSNIEYKFIIAPIAEDGGYAYMSPATGLAINKNSDNIDWSLEFMNFLFTKSNNKEFAEAYNIIPNTKDAIECISKEYGIKEENIAQPADVQFDYNLFSVVNPILINVTKANNPKYMIDNGDGTYTMYDFDYYMDQLDEAFKQQKAIMEGAVE